MIDIGLFDGCFTGQKSATLGGDSKNEIPKYINWIRSEYRPVTFFTDTNLTHVKEAPKNIKKIAWLIEPPSLHDTHYKIAEEKEHLFDNVLTFNIKILNKYPRDKWVFYPLGGSWIPLNKFGMHNKSREISLISSQKQRAPGHKLRHDVAKLADVYGIDVMGRGYREIVSKTEGLTDYRFSIIIESCWVTGYFSEKIVDCFSQGTIPIYWGCPDIANYFAQEGMILVENINDIKRACKHLGENLYQSKIEAVRHNLELAKKYRCVEDWLYENKKDLFINGKR